MHEAMDNRLTHLVADELARSVDPRVPLLAEKIAARHPGARAVLFYGSCLRAGSLDGLMLDFYVIVADYRAAFGRSWLATANRLLPPNVFPFEADGLAAKYAVLSEADFARLASPETRSVSIWARFAQPSRLVWAADDEARAAAIAAVARAAPTLLRAARPMLPDEIDALDLWRCAFALTYAAELRAERGGRAASVVDAEPERYRDFTAPALAAAGLAAELVDDTIRFHDPVTPPAGRAASGNGRGAGGGQAAHPGAPRQGQRHLRRRHRLSRLEDQPPRRHEDRHPPLAAASPDIGRDHSAAATDPGRLDTLTCANADPSARSSAARVKGLRRISWPARSAASPASPT